MNILRRLFCLFVGHDWDYNYRDIDGCQVRVCCGCGMRQLWSRSFIYGAYLPGKWVGI